MSDQETNPTPETQSEEMTFNGYSGRVEDGNPKDFTEVVVMAQFHDTREDIHFVIPGLWYRPLETQLDGKTQVAIEAGIFAAMIGADLSWHEFGYNPETGRVRFEKSRAGKAHTLFGAFDIIQLAPEAVAAQGPAVEGPPVDDQSEPENAQNNAG